MTDIVVTPRRALPGKPAGFTIAPLVATAAILVIWEVATAYVVNPIWIARPSAIAERLWVLTSTGDLLRHTGFTVYHALAGLVLSIAVGVPIGILFGSFKAIALTFETLLLGFYSLPRIALAPLFILWFGIGEFSKIMMTFSMVVFVVILNTYEGLRGVDPELIDMMRAMRAPRHYILRKVQLPIIVPWVLASIRVGIGLALVGAVIGELLGANRGLGWYIEYSAARFDVVGVFAGLVVLMAVGMGLNEIINAFDNRVWRRRVA